MPKPKPLLVVEIGPAGVNRIISKPRNVSEANACARLVSLTTLPLRLLHDAVREGNVEVSSPELPHPEIQ